MPLKKMRNRRLYGQDIKGIKAGYVKLEDIRDLLLQGEPVVRYASGEDVATEVLVSLIDHDRRRHKGPTAVQLREFILHYSKDHPSDEVKRGAFRAWRGSPVPQKPDSTP